MPELSVLIPARHEQWLGDTVADVLAHSGPSTEVIVILDGAWPEAPLPQDPRLHVVYLPESIGQRACTNLGARLSQADYICKLDAHCAVAEGWDRALLDAAAELGPTVTQVPKQYRLHVYNQVCDVCGTVFDQAPDRDACTCGGALHHERVWQRREGGSSSNWVIDGDLHFQYASDKTQVGDYPEVMSILGACLFVHRESFLALGGFDESIGSWGQYGQEWACKVWLSGGRVVCNRRTWYAHFFRVGGIGFPYPIKASDQDAARDKARAYWRANAWPLQRQPLRWLVDRFQPRGWTPEQIAALPLALPPAPPTKGIVFYTDNRLDPAIASAVIAQLERVRPGPIVAVSLHPMTLPAGWTSIVLDQPRGYLTMFAQILAGLQAIECETVFLCEHDVLYHESHFAFTPPNTDQPFYNLNVWKIDAATGRALHYDCQQTSGLCASRDLLRAHYRARVEKVQAHGFSRKMGFEPGTHQRPERVDDLRAASWRSKGPNLDIRHRQNLTPSRWRKEDFRHQRYTAGWTERAPDERIPGWVTGRDLVTPFTGASV